jgi:hypothetical protein
MCPRRRKRNTWLIDKMPGMRSPGEAIRIVLTSGTNAWNGSGANPSKIHQNDIDNPTEAGRAAGQVPTGKGIMAIHKNRNGSRREATGNDDLAIGNGPTTVVNLRNGLTRCPARMLVEAVI